MTDLPHDDAAEIGVLGSMLLSRDAIAVAMAGLAGEDFMRGSHRKVFEAIVDMHCEGNPVDIVTVADHLGHQLADVGGPVALVDMQHQVPSPANIAHYVAIVARHAASRRLLQVADELVAQAAEPSAAASQAIQRLEQAAAQRTTFRLLEGDAIDTLADPRWLVDGVLPEGLSMLYGPSGAGKSFLALSWACAVASHTPWFRHATTHAPVVYVAAEGAGGIKLRRTAWRSANHHPDLANLAVVPHAVDPADASQQTEMARHVERLGAGLVVWDTVARCMDGDENETGSMKRFVAGLDRLRERTGASQLVVHHTGHDKSRPRGSTALFAACDGVVRLSQAEPREARVVFEKAKDSMPSHAMTLEIKQWAPSAVLMEVRPRLSAVESL